MNLFGYIAVVLCLLLGTRRLAAPIQEAAAIQAERLLQIRILSLPDLLEKDRSEISGVDRVAKSGAISMRDLALGEVIQATGGPTEFVASLRVTSSRGGERRTFGAWLPEVMQLRLKRDDVVNKPRKGRGFI